MAKQRNESIEHGRGSVCNNALGALVTSKVYQSRTMKPARGKGAYTRKGRHSSKEDALLIFLP